MSIVGVEDEAQAIASLVMAFVRDPVMRWMYPEPDAYLAHFPTFARRFGGSAFDAGTAWTSADRGGASFWLPRDVHADGEAIADHVFSTIDASKHETAQAMFEAMDAAHPEEPHWYLAIVGVDAAHQGKGLGSKLVQAGLERCDQDGVIAYLESSNPANIPLYERHGFEVVMEIQEGDAPPFYPMRRAARG
jgi:ribosomal protein S18 acetylase RimI-like enzyme